MPNEVKSGKIVTPAQAGQPSISGPHAPGANFFPLGLRAEPTPAHIQAATRLHRGMPHLAERVFGTPLLIEPRKLEIILNGEVGQRIFGHPLQLELPVHGFDEYDDEPKPQRTYKVTDAGIAIIPVSGTLLKKGDFLSSWSGNSTYSKISRQFQSALDDDGVKAILFDIDSPGGETHGAFELSDQIFEGRGKKPLYASANDLAASAAYAIASACDKIFVTRTGAVGSIGVFSLHTDQSDADEQAGLKYTYIYAGDKKVDGNPHERLSKSAKNDAQAEVDRQYEIFVDTVARNRKTTRAKIIDTEAMCFHAELAVPLLADKVGTCEDALAALEKRIGVSSTSISASAVRGKASNSAADNPAAKLKGEKQMSKPNALLEMYSTAELEAALAAKKSKKSDDAEDGDYTGKRGDDADDAESRKADDADDAESKKADDADDADDAEDGKKGKKAKRADDADDADDAESKKGKKADKPCDDEDDDGMKKGKKSKAKKADDADDAEEGEEGKKASAADLSRLSKMAAASGMKVVPMEREKTSAQMKADIAQITQLCEIAGMSHRAGHYINKYSADEMSVKQIRDTIHKKRLAQQGESASSFIGTGTFVGGSAMHQMQQVIEKGKSVHAKSGGKRKLSDCLISAYLANRHVYNSYCEEQAMATVTPAGMRSLTKQAEQYLTNMEAQMPRIDMDAFVMPEFRVSFKDAPDEFRTARALLAGAGTDED